MPSSGVTVDRRSMEAALESYAAATGKDMVDVLNRAGGNIALRAVQLTEKATHTRMKTTAAYDPDKRPANRRTRFHYALSRKRGRATDRGSVKTYYNRRRSSRAYIAAGFLKPAQDFGKKLRTKPIKGGDAARGRGIKARRRKLVAFIENYSDGADSVGAAGVNKAINKVIPDMKDFAARKMGETARKHSRRKTLF